MVRVFLLVALTLAFLFPVNASLVKDRTQNRVGAKTLVIGFCAPLETGANQERHRDYECFGLDTVSGISINWYSYVGGDPVNRFDPDGLDWISASAKAFDEVFTNTAKAAWDSATNGYRRFNCSSWTQIGQAVSTSGIENIKNAPFRNIQITKDLLTGWGTALSRTFKGAYNISSDQGKTDFLVGGLEVFGTLSGALAAERSLLTRLKKGPKKGSFRDQMSPDEAARYDKYWKKRAPENSEPYSTYNRYNEAGDLKQTTTYDKYGRRHRQYDVNDGRWAEHQHDFEYSSEYPRGTRTKDHRPVNE